MSIKMFVPWKRAIVLFVAAVSVLCLIPTMLLRKTFELLLVLHYVAYKLDEVVNEIVAPLIIAVYKWSKK